LFVDNYYFQLSLFNMLDILCIGRMYKERIIVDELVVDVDYAYRINTYLFGLIKVQKILSRDDAIKAKWITERGTSATAVGECDIEVEAAGNYIKSRDSEELHITDVYGYEDEEVGRILHYGDINTATTNPIHTPLKDPTDRLQDGDNQHESLRLQRLQQIVHDDTNKDTDKVTSTGDDDAALYLEYQTLQNVHDDAIYNITNDSEISFEEWKTRRKQFKQGILIYSFIVPLTQSFTSIRHPRLIC